MKIGEAIEAMELGLPVARSGWNGKNMYIYLKKGFVGEYKGGPVTYDPYIVMKTATGTHQQGWLCSQADLLASDWEVVRR